MRITGAAKSIGASALMLALATNLALAGSANPNPKVLPIGSTPHGLPYGEWSGKWWQWAYSFPADSNPVSDTTGELASLGQSGPVWFLAGTWSSMSEPVTRTVTLPVGKALFVPILNTIWVNTPEFGDDPWSDTQRDFARSVIAPFIDDAFNLTCEIDGAKLANLDAYRCKTPNGAEYMVTFPENSVWLPAGTYGPSVDDGIYLMVAPLSAGQHTIHFAAQSVWFGAPVALDVTYHLTVLK